jgi:hypothetical protein
MTRFLHAMQLAAAEPGSAGPARGPARAWRRESSDGLLKPYGTKTQTTFKTVAVV